MCENKFYSDQMLFYDKSTSHSNPLVSRIILCEEGLLSHSKFNSD